MDNSLEQYMKECEEMQLAGMLWWLLLWYASDGGRLKIPSEQEWLSCELVATIVEETTGEKFKYSWCHNEFGRAIHQPWNVWPGYLNNAIERRARKLPYSLGLDHAKCGVITLLKRFVMYRFVCEHDDKGYESDLKLFYEGNKPTARRCSQFNPDQEMYRQAMEYVEQRQQVLGFDRIELLTDWLGRIGIQIMRPRIERDVDYIKSHYAW